ncbi:thiamine biosynthesis protein ThiF [Hydrococcus rivularis NIES-593]|uniref:Thiamine biosynthesis protein ThiF n=1 Tax=Hydrococcus rivularis NIES-593 TaxID=1921803 RepID=A0A1U7HPQ0_9CYAN|nr:HetP family heterocyst commitment protein [Hydrococcus rivularis]OKH25573.1 thiamine biosynthesis protein ThiF [Hydrococcus rivularis NIES-593]
MGQKLAYNQAKQTKAMTDEQFEQIVEAILAGKYSWACVLILRFAGYNPLHYIPYRTYNRLLKDNCLQGKSTQAQPDVASVIKSSQGLSLGRVTQIDDLNFTEEVDRNSTKVRGGMGIFEYFWR